MTAPIIAIDCETTGLSPAQGHRIVSLALVKGSAQGPSSSLYLVFNPNRKCDSAASRIHGLKASYLKRQPDFSAHAAQIQAWLSGATLIGHNIGFDLEFINSEMTRAGQLSLKNPVICTMRLAQDRWGRRMKLGDVVAKFTNDPVLLDRPIHHALDDACLALGAFYVLSEGRATFGLFAKRPPDNEVPATSNRTGRKKDLNYTPERFLRT